MATEATERREGDVVWRIFEFGIQRGVVHNVQNEFWIDVSWDGFIRNPYTERSAELCDSWQQARAEFVRRAEAAYEAAGLHLAEVKALTDPTQPIEGEE
jgi:hypothetical protein